MRKIQNALISVSNKDNLRFLIDTLKKYKIKIVSSGGTYKKIQKLGFKCTELSSFTGTNEILDGRVKTLHPKIYGGILFKRQSKKHLNEIKKKGYENIDLVIVNFYPFEKVLTNNSNHNKIIENIDIGGPSMVRAAAKNYKDVVVISNPNQYKYLIKEININKGSTSLNFRKNLAEEAFMETAYYESKIFEFFNKKNKNIFPSKNIFSGKLIKKTRYGENPHQQGAIYAKNDNPDIIQISGKELSYNNYDDIYSALNLTKSFPHNRGVVIIKHANACGVSIHQNKIKSFKEALESDPISAYGGIVSCNFKMNIDLAKEIGKVFFEVVIAKGFDGKSLNFLKKKKNLRIIDCSNLKENIELSFKSKFNSILIQNTDNIIFSKKNFKVVSRKKPNKETLNKLIFAFNVCRNIKSNAIVITHNYKTVGIGSGQPSRLDSCQIAINKMRKFQDFKENEELLAASDAFFPFVDGIEKLVQSGVTAIIQPSGSKNDKDVIRFANQTNTILVFSKTRHFNH